MSLYIRLFHGRPSPDTQLEDWGSDGPLLGPIDYVHMTYLSEIQFGSHEEGLEGHFGQYEDLIYYGGSFYGDLSISTKTEDLPDPEPIDPIKLIMPVIVRLRCQSCDHTELRACIEHPLKCSQCESTSTEQVTKQKDQPNED